MLKKYNFSLRFSSLASSVLMLSSASLFSQLIGILFMPLFTRLYTPADFGGLAVYSSTVGILVVIASLRYELAIPQVKSQRAAISMVYLCMIISILLSLLYYFAIFLFSETYIEWVANRLIEPFLYLMPLSFVLVSTFSILNYYLTRSESFREITRAKVSQAIAQTLTRLIFGFYYPGVLGLIVANLASFMIGAAIFIYSFFLNNKAEDLVIKPDEIKKVAIQYQRFPKFMVLSSLMNTASLHLPVLCISFLYGKENAGFFLIAQNLLGLPITMIGQSVSQALHAKIVQCYQREKKKLFPLYRSVTFKLFIVALIPVILIELFAEPVFALLFGQNWQKSGDFAAVLSVMFLFRFIYSPTSNFIYIIEAQSLSLLFQLVLFLSSVFVWIYADYANLTVDSAVFFFSIVTALSYFLMLIISFIKIRRLC